MNLALSVRQNELSDILFNIAPVSPVFIWGVSGIGKSALVEQVLQPGIDLLEKADDFPKNGPILIITDGEIEEKLYIKHEHVFLLPKGNHLPFKTKGKVFYYE